jgi:hypothetical protein
VLYVKLDSRLRGHLRAAIDGALEGADAEIAPVAPAFPAQRRTAVVGRRPAGCQDVSGSPSGAPGIKSSATGGGYCGARDVNGLP